MNQRLMVILFVVFFLVLTIAVGVYFSPFNWKLHPAWDESPPLSDLDLQSERLAIKTPPDQTTHEPSEVANWKTLVSKHGWSIKYPTTWEASGLDNNTAEEDWGPIIQGPQNCFGKGLRCGLIQISAFALPSTEASLSAKQFLLEHQMRADPQRELLTQRDVLIAGRVGYEISYRQRNAGGYANGAILREIAVKYQDKMYDISVAEDFKDRTVIRSTNDWQLVPLFEQILSTFKIMDAQ